MGECLILKAGGGIGSDEVTASKAQVLSGYTAVTIDSGDEAADGGMPDKTGWSSSGLKAGGSVTIPKGYHDGTKSVTAASLASQTAATAVAANITEGKTAYVGGKLITGSGADNTTQYNSGYSKGVTDADGRANVNSTNYKTGYNKGVTDADARVNTSSASYTSGYNAGKQPITMEIGCGASKGLDPFLAMNIERYSTFSWTDVVSICGGGSISVYGDNTLLKTVSLPSTQDGKKTTVNFSANVASYSSLKITGDVKVISNSTGLAYVTCTLS